MTPPPRPRSVPAVPARSHPCGAPPRRDGGHGRARAVVRAVAAALVAAALLAVAGPASGSPAQDEGPEDPGSAPTTTTTAPPPPTTVVLDGGDIGVVPPGADGPGTGDPAAGPPPGPDGALPDGPPPDGPPPDGPPPDGADVPVDAELPVVLLPDPTPGLNAALAAIDVTRARSAVALAAFARAVADDRAAQAAAGLDDAVRARRRATEDAVRARRHVEALAVNVVVYGDAAGLEPLLGAPDLDRLRDLELRDVTTGHLQDVLDDRRDRLHAALDAEAEATEALRAALARRRAADAVELDARRDLDLAVAAAEAARRQLGPTLLGPAALDEADLVAWWRTFYAGDPPVAPIEELVATYLRVAAEEGVAGDVAFAQAVLETGGFRSDHARGANFAGIGAYDSCAPTCGFRFPSLEAGVRAHVQLLRAYADATLTRADLAAPPDPRLAPERVGVRGCCPRWTSLTGVWASDPNYDRKVLGIYRLMVETARFLDALAR